MTGSALNPLQGQAHIAKTRGTVPNLAHSRAVFLDKDGTLVKDVPYNVDPQQVILEEGVTEGLRLLANAGYRLVVVSNQSGVARGYFSEDALQSVFTRLQDLLSEAGVTLDGFYYCPHHPEGSQPEYALECSCRKPRPGLLQAAARDLNINLAGAWMVGDILNDVEAGHRAGCRSILINNGNETEWLPGPLRGPDFTASNLEEAARIILAL
jgi:D-glycero-D-manno-heptose 1,7-bisphosphate phosphatase